VQFRTDANGAFTVRQLYFPIKVYPDENKALKDKKFAVIFVRLGQVFCGMANQACIPFINLSRLSVISALNLENYD